MEGEKADIAIAANEGYILESVIYENTEIPVSENKVVLSVRGAAEDKEIKVTVLQKYLISFVNYDGELLQSSYVSSGEMHEYTGAVPARPNDDMYSYTFVGWDPLISAATGEAVYTAQFAQEPMIYLVTLHTNGGTILQGNIEYYVYGTEAKLPLELVKEGYRFAGWYENESFAGEATETIAAGSIGDKVYYAKWEEIEDHDYCDVL